MKRLILLAILVAACGGGGGGNDETDEPTQRVTDAPEFTLPHGYGEILFGTGYDPDTLDIIGERVRFKNTYHPISWRASFLEPAGATTILLTLSSKSAGGAESVLYSLEVDLANPDFDLLANSADLALILDNEPGTYVMRYIREGTVLAEGEFELVP